MDRPEIKNLDDLNGYLTALEERIAVLEQEELDALRPPIDGNQVMAHLGLEPGPEVGEVMKMLYERRIEDGPFTEDEAYVLLDEWAAERR